MYTILHLSDLHRSPADPISNAELLSSLIADHAKYANEEPAGPTPDAIIVSGDIIQGVTVGEENSRAALQTQYAVATVFLESLVDQFLNGDRSRLIIVPGNHDVDWNVARGAMQPTPESDIPAGLNRSTLRSNPLLRWSWQDRSVFSIVDRQAYEDRLAAFRQFYSAFYKNVPNRLRQEPYEYWDLFELCDGRIVVAGFNSCANNDCFSYSGDIPPDAVASAHMEVERNCVSAELLMAVWHHSIEGGPHADDYMDVETVHRLIGSGFRLGLHGHQHRAEVSYRYILLPEEERMAVVSAGSLCAGQVERPTGVNRQYNLVVLNDDLTSARIYVREMAVATVFGPSLRAELGGKGYVDLVWADDGFLSRKKRAIDSRREATILQAEREWREGRTADAASMLKVIDAPGGSYERRLLLTILEESNDFEGIEKLIGTPTDINELVSLVHGRARAKDFNGARTALSDWSATVGLPQPLSHDLLAFIAAAEATEGS